MLSSSGQLLDFSHSFGLLAFKGLDLSLKLALRTRDNFLLLFGSLFGVYLCLLVSHTLYLYLIITAVIIK